MFELFKLIGLGLVLLLPLVNPLTTVALFLGFQATCLNKKKEAVSDGGFLCLCDYDGCMVCR